MSVYLKIKSKHLALEPAIIRKEEEKVKKQIKHYKMYHQVTDSDWMGYYKSHPDLYNFCAKHGSLVSHRRWEVRNEARATYLARAYIKHMPYKVVEANTQEKLPGPVIDSLIRMIMKYGAIRYYPEYTRDESGKTKIAKTAEAKAKEDVLAWLNKE
jgi:hypothetical protein